jgi:hypothetical protein
VVDWFMGLRRDMNLRRGMVWGGALTLVTGLLTYLYLSSITIDDGLEGLIFVPIAGVLFSAAGVTGGWRGRSMTWGWGLAAGATATMVLGELLWLIVWLVTRRTRLPEGDPLSAPLELFSLIALAGTSTVVSIAGFVVILSMLGWFIGSTARGRRLRRFPPPPAVLDQA